MRGYKMAEQSILQNLSRSISQDERDELLEKINRSLQLRSCNDNPIVHSIDNHADRTARIRADMAKSGFFTQIQLWFSSLFSVKTAEERFVAVKTTQLIKKIQNHGHDLIDSDGAYIGPGLARKVSELYEYAKPLQDFFSEIWVDEGRKISEFAAQLAWKHIPEPKTSLIDFIDKEQLNTELLNISPSNSLEYIENTLINYVNDLHPQVFELVADDLAPLYLLRDAVQFPYYDFLNNFKLNDNFARVKFSTISGQLEQLYYVAYVSSRLQIKNQIAEVITSKHDHIANSIHAFYKAILSFFESIPLAEIIKAGKMDPYYRFLIYVPRIDIKTFFISYLKLHILKEYDETIPKIRVQILRKQIDSLFLDNWKNPLHHLNAHQSPAAANMGFPIIHRVNTLGIFYSYVKNIYNKKHESLALYISKNQTKRVRQTNSDMLLVLSNIDDISNRIEKLNQSLAPDANGTNLSNGFQLALKREPSAQRQYRIQMGQLDREVEDLANMAIDSIQSLTSLFDDFSKRARQSPTKFSKSIENATKWLNDFLKLLNVAIRVEDEHPKEVALTLEKR